MKKKIMLFVLILFLSVPAFATAETFDFGGNIAYHNDVVFINFSLANDATNVRVWTDSFAGGGASSGNFDPITALWTSAGVRLAENDDDDSINPATQSYYDSGFSLPTLSAGNYMFSIACYDNYSNGTLLSQGFMYDGDTPIALGAWTGSDISTDELDPNIGTYWHVILDGVDSASHQVPEPATLLLLGFGLAGLATLRKKI